MGRYDEISAKDLLLLLGQRAWPRAVDAAARCGATESSAMDSGTRRERLPRAVGKMGNDETPVRSAPVCCR